MTQEKAERIPLQNTLKNGDIISQKQFTELILQQNEIGSLTLFTQGYMTPRGDGGSVAKIHRHLLDLADQGTPIQIGIDHNYAHLIAPHSDFPNKLAPFFVDKDDLKEEQKKKKRLYEDLSNHPNIGLVFHGEGDRELLPFSRFDHRKILLVQGSKIQDFAVIYGFNMDETLDHDVDSGMYITDPEALKWIDTQCKKDKGSPAEKIVINDFAFLTKETTKNGDMLAAKEISNLIRGAKSNLIFCGQFIPDGKLLDDLVKAASRGVEVVVISNDSSPSRQPMYIATRKLAEIKLARACKILENLQFYVGEDSNTFVHMKALIADIDQPSLSRAITGTDNMANPLLSYLKTREILVELLNYDHIQNLYEFLRNNVFPHVKRVKF